MHRVRACPPPPPRTQVNARDMASLLSVTNNPRASWYDYLGLPEDFDDWTLVDVKDSVSAYLQPAADGAAPTSTTGREEILLTDFSEYMKRVGEPYRFMAANRPKPSSDGAGAAGGSSSSSGVSAAVSAELKTVPEACFQADFDLSKPETFGLFSPPEQTAAVGMVTLERLGGYLDTVELTLLAEVSTRSEGFFDALKSCVGRPPPSHSPASTCP